MDSNVEQASETASVDARRESRRKKILQTAKARLEKLNNGARAIENHTDSTAKEVLDYSDPEVEPNFPIGSTFNDNIFHSTTKLSSSTTEKTNKFLTGRIHIFIASIFGYILSRYIINSLFIPVFLCIIIEIFYLQEHQKNHNNIVSMILPIALLFTSAFLGNKVKQINRFLYISQSLIVNIAVNVFCICMSSYIFQFKSVSHVSDIK